MGSECSCSLTSSFLVRKSLRGESFFTGFAALHRVSVHVPRPSGFALSLLVEEVPYAPVGTWENKGNKWENVTCEEM